MSHTITRLWLKLGDLYFELLDSAYALWYAIRPRPYDEQLGEFVDKVNDQWDDGASDD